MPERPDTTVPTLRLSDYDAADPERRDRFCRGLFAGLTRYGFVVLEEHPVDAALLERAYALSAELFASDDTFKRRFVGGPRGYSPPGTETAKGHHTADLKEFWQIGPERQDHSYGETEPPNLWPPRPAGWREVMSELFAALQATGRRLMEALTPGLGLPPDYFEAMLDDGNSVLRVLHYPPVPAHAPAGSLRAAPHEDINLITLLVAADGPGLELLDRDGRWLPVTSSQHSLIVDSGDMLARITNDVIPATTHRVVNPDGDNVSRYSMPFFMHPNSDAILRCLPGCAGAGARYPDIRAADFLAERLRQIGLLRNPR